MNTTRSPLFCDAALAERIERVETQLIARGSEAARRRRGDTAGFVIPVAGGVASFAEEGSPLNKVAGLGFAGVPSEADLDEIERAFRACDAPVQIELAHLVDPAIGTLLTERGYRLVSFENVLGLALDGDTGRVTPPGVEVRPSGDDEFVAGGASIRLAEGVAQLTGAATAPAHRRRGIQTALLSARLADATAAGCDVAVVTTQPGSRSQQNVQRRGF